MNGTTELTEQQKQMLEFERTWWKYPGAKEDEIRRRFDLTATAYYQRLNALIEQPAALVADPMVVGRLRRLRDRRRRRNHVSS